MTETQRAQWRIDRARQAALYTFSVIHGSRGYWLRRANNGLALRTFRHIKEFVL